MRYDRRAASGFSRFPMVLGLLVAAALVPVPVGSATSATTAASDDVWTPTEHTQRSDSGRTRVAPRDYEAYTLDVDAMTKRLESAPRRATAKRPARTISVPAPSGELVKFAVSESPVMQRRLAAEHPEIGTYAGHAVDDPSATIRLDISPTGFHASVRGAGTQGPWYVDPASLDDDKRYLSYLASELPGKDFSETGVHGAVKHLGRARSRLAPDEDVALRTYRLALVNDPSYARYFGTENVLAEKVTLINRVNQIYNDDLAIRLRLANGTDKLNLDTKAKAVEPGGPCGPRRCFAKGTLNTCSTAAIQRNDVALGQLIGAGKYDIGHIALGLSGGGVAGLGVVGGARKAVGCTGLETPEGDYYAVDYVAHEVGHQFGANHTFSGNRGFCPGGRVPKASVEPGSGSSVMAYAGICGKDDLQPHTDPYFSQRSIREMTSYVNSDQPVVNEMQTISLRRFNRTQDEFRLRTGAGRTARIAYGDRYTAKRLDRVLEKKLGADTVSVTGWGGVSAFGPKGFSVRFHGKRAGKNQPPLSVVTTGGDVSATVRETTRGGPSTNGGRVRATANSTPTVSAPTDKRLPLRTPFTLTAKGSDPDGDDLTYVWEQNDRATSAGSALFAEKKQAGPLFRIFGRYANVTPAGALRYQSPGQNHASSDRSRTFPDLRQVLNGNTNAATGSCPASKGRRRIACHSEWLPTADYTGRKERALHFRVTARDHASEGGGTGYDDVTLTLAPKAGPLRIGSFADPDSAVRGTRTQRIRWQVNGTAKPALAPRVRIRLSTDGGKTFDTVLKKNTANDGRADVTWPNVDTERARLKIEARGNYFFAVNDADFTIVPVR